MISPADFQFVRDLVSSKAAIVVEDGKEYLVEARLSLVMKARNLHSISEVVELARKPGGIAIEHDIINVMTTNETSFFRDIHPFEHLKKKILPDLLNKRAAEKTIRIWCAASSSGQEPYSIAMILNDHVPANQGWKISILATDLSTDILAKAKEGKYTQFEVNRGLPMPLLIKHFERYESEWRVKQNIRDMVDYKQLNLSTPWPYMPQMDIVFLRNVMIYFANDTKKTILTRIHDLLRSDGCLFLGGAETTLNLDVPFERIAADGTTIYVPKK